MQIILTVRKSVRSIIDLDPKHQSQGTYSHTFHLHYQKKIPTAALGRVYTASALTPISSNLRLRPQSPPNLHLRHRRLRHRQRSRRRNQAAASGPRASG